jgi:Fe-S cluster assembly scaffold protein SufB
VKKISTAKSAQEFNLSGASFQTPEEIADILEESKMLMEYRKQAFKAYLDLPVDRDTLFYKYTKFTELNLDKISPITPTKEKAVLSNDIEKQIAQLVSQTSGFIVETSAGIAFTHLSEKARQQGVIVSELGRALQQNYTLVQSLIKNRLFNHDDKLAALNSALATNRALVFVPNNIILEKPIRRVLIQDAPNKALFSELLVYTGENSFSRLVEEIYSSNSLKTSSLISLVEEFHIGANSQLKIAQIQDLNKFSGMFSNRRVSFDLNAKFGSISHLQGGILSRLTNELLLNSPGSEAQDLYTMHGTGRQRFDVKSLLSHKEENTIGSTNTRCIMRERAEATLRGMIHITGMGKNADSWLKADGLLSEKGKFNAVPALAIDNNEVRAAHAATVTQIDEEDIFYLLTRGITELVARNLILLSYLEPVLSLFNDKQVTNLIRQISARKWSEQLRKPQEDETNILPLPKSEDYSVIETLHRLTESNNSDT